MLIVRSTESLKNMLIEALAFGYALNDSITSHFKYQRLEVYFLVYLLQKNSDHYQKKKYLLPFFLLIKMVQSIQISPTPGRREREKQFQRPIENVKHLWLMFLKIMKN